MDKDINRELAEDAALDYSDDARQQKADDETVNYALHNDPSISGMAQFADGWMMFCSGEREPDKVHIICGKGYLAARDAPE